ncbi:MAG: hypothetical protein IIX81_02730, partial [Tidjanibacter sp.]|nr:hypothetical protein [Tidjanibacter sp.]
MSTNQNQNPNGGNPNPQQQGGGNPRGPQRPENGIVKGFRWLFYLWGLFLVGLMVMQFTSLGEAPVKTDWAKIEQMLVAGDVEKIVVINDKTAQITLKEGAVEGYRTQQGLKNIPAVGYQFTYNVGNPDILRADLQRVADKYGVEVPVPGYEYPTNVWGEVLSFLPYLLLIFFMFWMFRSAARGPGAQGGVMNVGKAKAQVFDKNSANRVTFKDVAGLE